MKAIVIMANGWNAGWLGCYGNEWISTPHIDRLAAESVLFDQHLAINPSIQEWRRSLTSGCFDFDFDSTPRPSLLKQFRRTGCETIRIQDGGEQVNAAGDDWDQSIHLRREADAEPGKALLATLKKQFANLAANENWLLWVETDRLLPPWSVALDYFDKYAEDMAPGDDGKPPDPWDEPPQGKLPLNEREIERLQGTFAAVVTEWDADLGRVFNLVEKSGLAASTLVVVSSGHGLALGEHDEIGPTCSHLYEEICHVPLLLRMPLAAQAGRRVDVQTTSIDLLPTIAAAFGIGLPDSLHGGSLLPLARGVRSSLRPYHCQRLPDCAALRTEDWAYLLDEQGTGLLFRKPEDRWEVNNVRMQHLEWAEHLHEVLRLFDAAVRVEPFVAPALKEQDEVVAGPDSAPQDVAESSAPARAAAPPE